MNYYNYYSRTKNTYTTDSCLSTKVSSFTTEYKHWLESNHNSKIYWENMARRKDNIKKTSIEMEKNLSSYLDILFEEQRVCSMVYCLLQEAKNNIDFDWIAECFRRGM